MKNNKKIISNSGINKRISEFIDSDNKVTRFCNNYIIKYLK